MKESVNFKEQTIIQKWSKHREEDLIILNNFLKNYLKYNSEKFVFLLLLPIYMIAPTIFLVATLTMVSLKIFTISLITFLPFWFFIKTKLIDQKEVQEFTEQSEELEIVLRDRAQKKP